MYILNFLIFVSNFVSIVDDVSYRQIAPMFHVYRACVIYKLEPELVFALAYNESRFRQDRISLKGAVGVMQLMPIHRVDRYDMIENIYYGVKYLHSLITLFGESEGIRRYYAGWKYKDTKEAHKYLLRITLLRDKINGTNK